MAKMCDTNLSVFLCCHAAIPNMRQRGGGWIVNISTSRGQPVCVHGCLLRDEAGLNASRRRRQEVRHDDIRVSYVMPGSVGRLRARRGGQDSWKLAPRSRAGRARSDRHPREAAAA